MNFTLFFKGTQNKKVTILLNNSHTLTQNTHILAQDRSTDPYARFGT